MFTVDTETEDIELKKVGLELMFLTPEKCSDPNGITAVELSKHLNMDVEIVKKKLRILLNHNIANRLQMLLADILPKKRFNKMWYNPDYN